MLCGVVVMTFKPRRRTASVALIDRPELDRTPAEADELDAPLEREAVRVRLHPPASVGELAEAVGSLEELWSRVAELEEATYWEPEKHPRWPKDTPGGLGGQFMRVGQRFELNGQEYDVAAVMPGKVWAHVATKGQHEKAGLAEFSSAQLAKATRPEAEAIVGAGPKGEGVKKTTATVVDAYVHPESHDPSIPIPEGSTITPEEWKRFGKPDQERYAQLMERYGKFKASETQGKIDAAYQSLDGDTKQLIEQAYYGQYYYTDPGFTLSLHSVFKGVIGFVKGDSQLEQARRKYEKTKAAQNELASLLQWDLYNRTHSPDLTIFKGHNNNQLFTTDVFEKKVPVYAGASFSQRFQPSSFGSMKFITPMAIRNVAMATVSAYATPTHAYSHEQEIAMADPWLADPKRSLNVPDGSSGYDSGGTHPMVTAMQSKWLQLTPKGRGGELVEQLLESFKDGGASLKMPPQPPVITMDSAGGPQYQTPPVDAMKYAFIGDKKLSVLDLPYDQVENGKPVAKVVKDMVENGEIQPGDYIEGMKGTRYIVVPDPSDKYLGLAYYKITDTGKPVADTNFVAPTGQDSSAFEGHQLFSGTEVYPFEGGGAKAWKKLKGHYDLPEISEETTGFFPDAWAEGGKDDEKFTSKFAEGEKFVLHGVPYEVVIPGNNSVKIKNLDTGKLGKINGDTKLAPLVLKAGYNEQGAAYLTGDDFLHGPDVELGSALEQLAPGHVFLVGQTLWKVSSQTGDGHVVATVAGKLSTPGEHEMASMGKEHTFGADQKATLMLDKPPGWEPAQVGDTTGIDGEKAKVTKVLKDGTVQLKLAHGGVVKMKPNDARLAYLHRPSAWEIGDKTKLSTLVVGERFHGGTGETVRPYQVVEQLGAQTMVRNLDTGEVVKLSSGKSYARLVPKQTTQSVEPAPDHGSPSSPASTFDPDMWESGETKPASQLELGEKFMVLGSSYEVIATSKGDNDDLGVAKNLATGQTQTYSKSWSGDLTTLQLKSVTQPQPESTAPVAAPPVVGGSVLFDPAAYNEQAAAGTIGELAPGAIFQGKTGAYMQIKKVSGKNVYAVNLGTGKPTKLAASIKPSKLMVAKAESETPYEQLQPTDPVKLGQLKEGDQFHSFGGLYEVVKPAAGDEDNVTVAHVAPDGTLGVQTDVGQHPLLKVTLYAKKADTLEVSAPAMAKLIDAKGDAATDTHEEVAAAVAAAGMEHNAGQKTLAELDPQPGDTFVHKDGDDPWKVTAVYPATGGVSATNLGSGNTIMFGDTYVPYAWQKGSGDESKLFVPEMPEIPSAAETGGAPGKTLENTIPLGQLALGTEFSFADQPGDLGKAGIVYKLVAKTQSGKSVKATVVSSNDPNVPVDSVHGFKGHTTVPDFIGAEGAHAAPPPPPGEKPTPIDASSNAADYVQIGKGTLGDVDPGGFVKTAMGVIYHVDSKNDMGGAKLTVVAVPDGSLMKVGEYTDGAASITAVTIVKPIKFKNSLLSVKPGEKLPPTKAKVGDHLIAGNGQKFEITAIGEVGTGGVVSATLKNVATGVEGGGYYTDETADWMKVAPPEPEPEPPAVKFPEPTNAKPLSDFPVGSTVTRAGWGSPVWRVVASDPDTKKVTLQVVKPGKNQPVGKKITSYSYSYASYNEYPGGPMWKPGEYAKVVKPGNKSGKTGLVVGYDGNKVKLLHTDGKEVSVPEDWLQWISPQYKTTEKFQELQQTKVTRVSGLEPGDIFQPHNGYYYSASVYVVDAANEDGTATAHAWGMNPAGYTKTFPAATKVMPLVTAGMAVPQTNAPQPSASAPSPPLPPGEKTVGKPVYPHQLEVGDTFTIPVDDKAVKYQVTSTKPVPGKGEYMLGLLGLEGDVGSTYEQSWSAPETKDTWIYTGKAQAPASAVALGGLDVGDVFAFHEGGAFLYTVTAKGAHGVTYQSQQSGDVTTDSGGAMEVWKDDAATEALKKPLNTLASGDHFYVGSGGWGAAGTFEVVLGDAGPSKIFGRNVETGDLTWFGDTLPVTPLPAPDVAEKIKAGLATVLGEPAAPEIAGPSSLIPEKTIGSKVESAADLMPGDVFQTGAGKVFRVDAKSEEAAPGVIEFTLTKLAGSGHPVGSQLHSNFSTIMPPTDWTYVEAPEATPDLVAPSTASTADVLVPYLWPKSGKKKFPKISTLSAGTKFRDKSGKTYTVKGAGVSGYVHYTDDAGQEYAAPADARVFVLT